MEDARQCPSVPLADHDHDPALAGLMLAQPAIATVLSAIGWLHVAAKISAVDFNVARYLAVLHFVGDGFAKRLHCTMVNAEY